VVGVFKPAIEASSTLLSGLATAASALGIVLAYLCYLRAPELAQTVASRAAQLYALLLRKYYVDEFYNLIVTRPLFFISTRVLNRAVDSFAIDGIADGTGLTVETSGQLARRIETGNVQHYALVYVIGAIAIAGYYLYLVIGG